MPAAVQVVKWSIRWCVLLSTILLQTSQAQASLRLVSSNPLNNAVDVNRNGAIVLAFSANLNGATGRIQLRAGNSLEPVTINVSASQMSVQPVHELLPVTTYVLNVSGLQSDVGDPLSTTVNLVFKTRDGVWQVAQAVTVGSEYLQSSRFALNKSDGTAMVSWTEHTGTLRTDLFASRYASGQWSAPQLINTNLAGEVFDSSIAVGKGGVAIAAWEESYTDNDGNTHFSIWGNAFALATGWAAPHMISNEASQGGFSPQVAMSPDGSALAVWYQYDHGTGRIFSRRYTSNEGWSAVTTIDAVSNAPGAFNPHIAFDNKGNAYAVWQQWWHGVTLIWGNRYIPGRGWVAPQIIQSNKSTNADAAQLEFDDSGNAVVVWTQSAGVFLSRYTRDQGWAASIPVSNGSEGYQPTVTVNSNGDSFVAWTQVVVTGTDGHGIPRTRGINWSNHFTTMGGWATPSLLQDANGFNSGNVSLAIDDSGNALAAWSESNGSFYRIYTNRYQDGIGWVRRKVIDSTNTIAATSPHIAIDANGDGLAVWEQTDAAGNVGIWSSRFD